MTTTRRWRRSLGHRRAALGHRRSASAGRRAVSPTTSWLKAARWPRRAPPRAPAAASPLDLDAAACSWGDLAARQGGRRRQPPSRHEQRADERRGIAFDVKFDPDRGEAGDAQHAARQPPLAPSAAASNPEHRRRPRSRRAGVGVGVDDSRRRSSHWRPACPSTSSAASATSLPAPVETPTDVPRGAAGRRYFPEGVPYVSRAAEWRAGERRARAVPSALLAEQKDRRCRWSARAPPRAHRRPHEGARPAAQPAPPPRVTAERSVCSGRYTRSSTCRRPSTARLSVLERLLTVRIRWKATHYHKHTRVSARSADLCEEAVGLLGQQKALRP